MAKKRSSPAGPAQRAVTASAVTSAHRESAHLRPIWLLMSEARALAGGIQRPDNVRVDRKKGSAYMNPDILFRRYQTEPALAIECALVDGGFVPEILRAAADRCCDLIVMGTHGRTGLGRLLMGSVAEGVMREAPCPVLTVRTPFNEAHRRAKEAAKVPEPAGV